jgi:hypothetical protein
VKELSADHWRCNVRPDRMRRGSALAAALLTGGELPMPPQLLGRVRVASPQLGLRQGGIAATRIDHFLTEDGL